MAKVDFDALKREIMSISEAAAADRPSKELRLLSRQRRDAAGRIVEQTLTKAGIDIAALQKKILENNRAFRDAAKGLQKPRPQTPARRKAAFERAMAQRRAALEPAAGVPTAVTTSTVYLPEPIFAFISPNSSSGFATASSIAPYDSRIKFFVPSTENGATVNCEFWFFWFNDSAFQVLVRDASSQTVCNGHVFAYVSAPYPSWLLNSESFRFSSGTNLWTYLAGGATYENPVYVSGEDFDLVAFFEDKQRDVSYDYQTLNAATPGLYIAVPPQSGILIRVFPTFNWDFGDEFGQDEGQAGNTFWADFANNDLDYFVQCSGVALEIQRPVVSLPGV